MQIFISRLCWSVRLSSCSTCFIDSQTFMVPAGWIVLIALTPLSHQLNINDIHGPSGWTEITEWHFPSAPAALWLWQILHWSSMRNLQLISQQRIQSMRWMKRKKDVDKTNISSAEHQHRGTVSKRHQVADTSSEISGCTSGVCYWWLCNYPWQHPMVRRQEGGKEGGRGAIGQAGGESEDQREGTDGLSCLFVSVQTGARRPPTTPRRWAQTTWASLCRPAPSAPARPTGRPKLKLRSTPSPRDTATQVRHTQEVILSKDECEWNTMRFKKNKKTSSVGNVISLQRKTWSVIYSAGFSSQQQVRSHPGCSSHIHFSLRKHGSTQILSFIISVIIQTPHRNRKTLWADKSQSFCSRPPARLETLNVDLKVKEKE